MIQSPGWVDLPISEIPEWNARLAATTASVFQYPYWNEPLRLLRLRPRYITYQSPGAPPAYACVLDVGPTACRAGLIQRGPVSLGEPGADLTVAIRELARWASREGYVFLRLTHSNPATLAIAAAVPGALRTDAFPLYREPQHELLILQHEDDEVLLRSFQSVARRNLRQAIEAGYQIRSSSDPELFREVWFLFERLAERKGFNFRPLESYLSLLAHARACGCAAVWVAYLADRPMQAILVVRDRDTAHYISGALDVAALEGRPSPSVLLHWRAMRECARLGASWYSLGTPSGPVQQFKQKFRPQERVNPPAVTLVSRKILYRTWSVAGVRLASGLRPQLKRLFTLVTKPGRWSTRQTKGL